MKLYIFEKKVTAGCAVLALPNDELKKCDIVTTQSLGIFKYDAPPLDFSDVPATPTHQNILFNRETHSKGFFVYDHLSTQKKASMQPLEYLSEIKGRKYDEIIIATDDDSLGHFTGYQLASQFDAFLSAKISRLIMHAVTKEHFIEANLNKVKLDDKGESASLFHETKRIFDFWWRVNSEKVFGELCHRCGLAANKAVSKYEIMTLERCLRNGPDLRETDLLDWMNNPNTRNPYTQKYNGVKAKIGSIHTHAMIISSLIKRGALQKSVNGKINVTDEGKAFLRLLHPRTHDIELPFRLTSWCQRSSYQKIAVKTEMARYIRQVFGRQLRYQRKHFGQK